MNGTEDARLWGLSDGVLSASLNDLRVRECTKRNAIFRRCNRTTEDYQQQ